MRAGDGGKDDRRIVQGLFGLFGPVAGRSLAGSSLLGRSFIGRGILGGSFLLGGGLLDRRFLRGGFLRRRLFRSLLGGSLFRGRLVGRCLVRDGLLGSRLFGSGLFARRFLRGGFLDGRFFRGRFLRRGFLNRLGGGFGRLGLSRFLGRRFAGPSAGAAAASASFAARSSARSLAFSPGSAFFGLLRAARSLMPAASRKRSDAVGRLGADAEPVAGALLVELDAVRVVLGEQRIVAADLLDELAVAGIAASATTIL